MEWVIDQYRPWRGWKNSQVWLSEELAARGNNPKGGVEPGKAEVKVLLYQSP